MSVTADQDVAVLQSEVIAVALRLCDDIAAGEGFAWTGNQRLALESGVNAGMTATVLALQSRGILPGSSAEVIP